MKPIRKYLTAIFWVEPLSAVKPVVISVVLSGCLLVWYTLNMRIHTFPGTPAIIHGDSQEYISSAFNLFLSDYFYPNGKLPGYAVFLSVFFNLFGFKSALWGIVAIQWGMHVISIVLLARLAFLIRPERGIYNLIFYTYALSSYVVVYAGCVLSDSLAVSCTIFCFYFLARAIANRKWFSYALAGIFFLIIVFLRPVMLSAGLAIAVYFLMKALADRRVLLYALIFFFPFLLGEMIWMRYNRLYHNDPHPLMSFNYYRTLYANTYYVEACEFVGSWGGDFNFWDPTAELMYFGLGATPPNPDIRLPDYIYTSAYTKDSLARLKLLIGRYEAGKNPDTLQYIKHTFRRYQHAFESEKPLLHYLSGFRSLKKFLINGWGAYNLYPVAFSQLSIIDKVIKLMYVAFYLLFGLFGWFCVFWQGAVKMIRGYNLFSILSLMVVLMTFVLTFFFKYCEYRYFAPIYPFTLMASCFCLFPFLSGRKLL